MSLKQEGAPLSSGEYQNTNNRFYTSKGVLKRPIQYVSLAGTITVTLRVYPLNDKAVLLLCCAVAVVVVVCCGGRSRLRYLL